MFVKGSTSAVMHTLSPEQHFTSLGAESSVEKPGYPSAPSSRQNIFSPGAFSANQRRNSLSGMELHIVRSVGRTGNEQTWLRRLRASPPEMASPKKTWLLLGDRQFSAIKKMKMTSPRGYQLLTPLVLERA